VVKQGQGAKGRRCNVEMPINDDVLDVVLENPQLSNQAVHYIFVREQSNKVNISREWEYAR
jgi:hypothetical protein